MLKEINLAPLWQLQNKSSYDPAKGDPMMEVRLQSLEMPECIHRISGVEDVEPVVDHELGILVHRLHIGGGRYLDYPADEWYMTISSVRRQNHG